MVPDNTALFNINQTYQTLVNLFLKMNSVTSEKKETIISGDWGRLTEIVSLQNELKTYFEKEEKKIATLDANKVNDSKTVTLKKELKQLITRYKEIENINIKLLKDSLYLAKLKANKIFKIPFDDETYTPQNAKKTETIGGGLPLMFDRLI